MGDIKGSLVDKVILTGVNLVVQNEAKIVCGISHRALSGEQVGIT